MAPYIAFLAPAAALSIGLPFVIGGAVFSAIVFALSAAVISKNKTISEKDAQLTEKDTKISSLKGQLAKKEKAIEAKNKIIVNPNKDNELKRQHRKKKQKEILDCADLRNLFKEEKQGEILDSKALGNLFREEGNQPKLNAVAKEVKGKAIQVAESCGAAVSILAIAALAPKLLFTPLCAQSANVGLSEQQAHLDQADSNSTINLSPARHVPTVQTVLESKVDEFERTLNNASKSAENNFGTSQNSSEPQWVKDLNKSETSEEIIDGGVPSNLFYEGSNSDYQFAKPNITHAESSKTVGSNQTAITKYSAAENAFMSTWGSFLRNLTFGSRKHQVNEVKGCNYQIDNLNVDRVEDVGSHLNSTKLSKLTTKIPTQSQFVMTY